YPDESAHCASFILQGIESEHLFRSGALLSNAGVVALLPRILALSVLPAALTVLRPGDGHSGCRATLGLILALRILHRVGRVVILIPPTRSEPRPSWPDSRAAHPSSRRARCHIDSPEPLRPRPRPRRLAPLRVPDFRPDRCRSPACNQSPGSPRRDLGPRRSPGQAQARPPYSLSPKRLEVHVLSQPPIQSMVTRLVGQVGTSG